MRIYGQFLYNGAPTHAEIEFAESGEKLWILRDLWTDTSRSHTLASLSEVEILPPVTPQKVFAIGLNYADHAREHGNQVPPEPLMWFKAPSALLAHGGEIELAFPDHRTDFEAELALIIGRRGKAIAQSDAASYIFGVCPAQDISDRQVQRGESQWARAKSFDTYAPLGPYIYSGLDLENLSIQSVLNGEIVQNGHTSQMIFSPARIVSFVSQHITLEPGDVILTGTPAGVGALKSGDVLETRIGDMKPLVNRVK